MKGFTDSDMVFTDIVSDKSGVWVGSRVGFGRIDGRVFESPIEHKAENSPFIQSPQSIQFIAKDQLMMGSPNGLSLSGWFNWSVLPVSNVINKNLKIQKSPIHLGTGISNILIYKEKLIIGLINSLSAGVGSIDISNGRTFR